MTCMRLGGVPELTVLALVMGAMSACGSMPESLSPSAQPSQTPTANAAALLNAKAEAACLTNVPVWSDAPRAECRQVYQSTPTMLILQADVILQGVTPRSEADASTHALIAHGWVLKRSTLNDQDEQRWLELATPVRQCLEVGALPLIRPGFTGVDLSVVYDYLFGSGPCPTN
jgi:hypothetical protein